MDLPWVVAHTRPRCEKKLAEFCVHEGLAHSLPLYRSVKAYRGKRVVFLKPLFPNYVFLRLTQQQTSLACQNRHVAALLEVPDQAEFDRQLGDILRALETELEIRLAPHIGAGARVKLKSGPLRGMEGWVEERSGWHEVLLRLDFIGQAAAVKVEADALELA